MLDLARLNRIRLHARPLAQRMVAAGFLMPNYRMPPGVEIHFEGTLPSEPVIFAMNHTDRYNYWPFQFELWRKYGRYTATWVKGKYYEQTLVGTFMERTNNLPTVSRGYIITKDFSTLLKRKPTQEEYQALRDLVNAAARGEALPEPKSLPHVLFHRPRIMLGRAFEPVRESYAKAIDMLFREMMRRFVALNREAVQLGLDLLIFPQGTRSKRLSKGRIGLAQIAMHLGKSVVPVGCNGSDRLYPGESPVARGGRVVYRFGEKIRPEDAADIWVNEPFEPFTPEAEQKHATAFQTYVDRLMLNIDPLLDPEYRFSDDLQSEGVQGVGRFV